MTDCGSNFEWHFWSQWHEVYLYTVSEQLWTTSKKEWQNEHLKQTKHQTKSQFVYKHMSHVTKAVGIFMIPKNESALAGTNRLVKDRFRKSGSM